MRKGDLVQVNDGKLLFYQMGTVVKCCKDYFVVRVNDLDYSVPEEYIEHISKRMLKLFVKYIDEFCKSNYYSLSDVYKYPSRRKLDKERRIRDAALIDDAVYRILSYNNKDFVAAYLNNGVLTVYIDERIVRIDCAYMYSIWQTDKIREYRLYWYRKSLRQLRKKLERI